MIVGAAIAVYLTFVLPFSLVVRLLEFSLLKHATSFA